MFNICFFSFFLYRFAIYGMIPIRNFAQIPKVSKWKDVGENIQRLLMRFNCFSSFLHGTKIWSLWVHRYQLTPSSCWVDYWFRWACSNISKRGKLRNHSPQNSAFWIWTKFVIELFVVIPVGVIRCTPFHWYTFIGICGWHHWSLQRYWFRLLYSGFWAAVRFGHRLTMRSEISAKDIGGRSSYMCRIMWIQRRFV